MRDVILGYLRPLENPRFEDDREEGIEGRGAKTEDREEKGTPC